MEETNSHQIAVCNVRADPGGPIQVWPALRVHECFELLADQQPSAPAVVSDQGTLTFAELDQKANALAHGLLAHGVMAEAPIGVLADRSGALPVAFLAILKAGGAYVPMGADLPPQRLANMATQAGMRCLIALDNLDPPGELLAVLAANAGTPEPAILRPEQFNQDGRLRHCNRPRISGHATDLAAILFTSGSTGRPKGVLLQHDACLNMGFGHISAQEITRDDRVLLAAAPGFIMGFRELCIPLLAGAALVPASRALLDDPARLLAAMSRHGVTIALFTPSYLRLLRGAVPAGLRCLLTAGERPNADDARSYARKLDYWNIQGATEVCGTICMTRVDPNGTGALPSGRPFSNTSVYLLDGSGLQVPPGAVGEIHVVGAGVARGYLNEPELTADRFVDTAYGRAYRSNDMGRWNADGQLESVGRADDLVKVSGQSVSLGEIEQTLSRHAAVSHAAAIQHEGRLIAFVASDRRDTTSPEHTPLEEWHRFLSKTLPAYMLPVRVTTLAKMPVNFSGKVDRKALAALAADASQSRQGADRGGPPRGQVEQQIAEVWEEALDVRPIQRDDNYFALGGTSLLAIAISTRLQALGHGVAAQIILVAKTVAALADKIALIEGQEPLATAPAALQDTATSGQEDFWIAAKLGLGTIGSQITRTLAVRGTVPEPSRWQSAWNRLLARHAALRTAFFADPDGQVIWRTVPAEDLLADVQFTIDQCASLNDARERIAARSDTPFTLTEPPLARAGLMQVVERGGETLFWFTLHHSVADGFSAQIVQDEMRAIVLGHPLPPAPNGMAQTSQAERNYLASGLVEHDRAWWRDKLDALVRETGTQALDDLATDLHRPATPSGNSAAPIVERLDAGSVAALTGLAKAQSVGLHALLLALLAAEVRRRDGRSNMIIGTGISVRPPGADAAVGCFVNPLPIVLNASNATPLAAQIRAAQTTLTEAVEHALYPSGLLYRDFRQQHPQLRAQSRTSLFDISLTPNPSRGRGDGGEGFALTSRRLPGELAHPGAGLDLAFSYEAAGDDGGGLELSLLWNPDVYRRDTAQAWLSSFAAWARWLAEDIARAGAPLPPLLPDEALWLAQWEQGPTRIRPAKRLHEVFETLAEQQPHRAIVIGETGTQNAADVERQANRIAWSLIDNGVMHEEPVAVLTACSADLPATVLGIWKAGAAYLPLALEQPPERQKQIVMDSGANTLIVLDGHTVPPSVALAFKTILRPNDWNGDAFSTAAGRPEIAGTPRDLAYVIYTSGTSGNPKGVEIQHDSLVNFVATTWEMFSLRPDDRISLVTTPNFDASLWELGLGLLHGIAIVPVSSALRDDPWALKRWYKTHGVTVAFHTPSWLRVSQQTPFEGLRVLATGGEAPNHDDARHHAGQLAFWNVYGPTEATVFLCGERLSPQPDTGQPLSIGRPFPNTGISIRRDNGDQVPPGVVGEVWLSGIGLARGYLNNPEQTARRFVQTADGRFYRSGDLAHWTDDGRLLLSGRIDHQVKLHGQRVELGEIEQAMLAHPAVTEAVTVVEATPNGSKTLRAFVRLHPAAAMPSEATWRDYFSQRLPTYMNPASVTAVAAIPLTLAGKIDRETLLQSPRERVDSAAQAPPDGENETRIAALWADLLGCSVSREANFFGLGGNSLLAVTVAHRLSRDLARPVSARDLLAAPTVAGFAQRLAAVPHEAPTGHDVQPPVQAGSDLATAGQREFWIAEAAGLDTRRFTIPLLRVVVYGTPSPHRWTEVWAALVARHDALRSYFREDADGRLRRVVAPALTASLEIATSPDRASAQAFIRQRQDEPFAMGEPPLWRAGLVLVAETGEHLFWLALHHALGDGRSLGIIIEEVEARLRGESFPAVANDFAESAAREEAYLAGPDGAADARYWRDLLARQPDLAFAEAPLDFPRSITAKSGNHRFETRLDASTAQGLKALARQHDASLHAVMLTLLALEARRRMGRADVIIGTAASIRETAAEAQVIGDYANLLPVPCRVPRDATFGAALRETQQTLAAGLQHARYPFARIYQDFRSARPQHRHPARYPLFDLAVTENPERPAVRGLPRLDRLAELTGQTSDAITYELSDASPGQDMVLIHEDLADGALLLHWHANAALFTYDTAKHWFEALQLWAVWLSDDLQRAQRTLPALLPHEAVLLEGWEQGSKQPRPPLRFHQLFERVLDGSGVEQGDRPAVVTPTATITYRALERGANGIAHALLLRGAAPGGAIGVLTGRSANLPAAILGIWKAGAAYLPLTADLPPERVAFMARDAGMTLLIALDGLAVPAALAWDEGSVLRPENLGDAFRRDHADRPKCSADADDSAYIIYTSGSTGQPKGVVVGHHAYVNMVLGAGETLGLTRDDRCLMASSPTFDVSLSDIGVPLAFGAALCPVPHDIISSPNRFRAFLSELCVTVADITPTYLRLLDGAALPSLRILVTGGEAAFAADVRTYADRLQYFNAYGPTENTISSTMGRLFPDNGGTLSAGRPLPNTSVAICDQQGDPVPPGVVGELWLGGNGLAFGYVGRSELTAAAFVATVGGRRYRSGDLGRWSATGELEILGRIDDQVKLNGIRVEPGEIEHALAGHPDIAQAVVLSDGDAERSHSLWGFVRALPGKHAPGDDGWRDYLANRLPAYMIPSAVMEVAAIPLTISGKVDKSALKVLLTQRLAQSQSAPPQDGMEATIALLWSELLGHAPIHRDDNFFALGGHSLLAIAVAHRLETTLGHPVSARELFVAPTLRGFAERVARLDKTAVLTATLSDRATEGQREFWVAEQAGFDTSGFAIGLSLRACGKLPTAAQWVRAWALLVARHAALRTSFREDPEGTLRRFVLPVIEAGLEFSDHPDMATALAHVRERQTIAFAMAAPPLWRAGLVHVAGMDQLIFWLALHHSVADGVSLGVLTEELTTLLNQRGLPPISGHFDRSAAQEEAYLAGAACQDDAGYWRTIVGSIGGGSTDATALDDWPLDFSRPTGRTARDARGAHGFRVRLDAATAAGLRSLAHKNAASLHALMLTIMAHEVRRRTGRSEFLLGTAASTRDSVSEARLVGYFVNMLPLACRIDASEPFEQALRTMQQTLAEALQHARYPFARMYRDARQDDGPPRHPARYPLFDLAVTENPGPSDMNDDVEGELRFRAVAPLTENAVHYEMHPKGPPQDMVLVHEGQRDGSLILQWYVNAALYEQETASAWIDSLTGWARLLAEPERTPGSALPALLPAEATLLAGWEQGEILPHPAPSFPAMFERWAQITPELPALISDLGTQSYAALNARANVLAHALLALDVARQEAVGVFADRSVALPETAMAIWKAGGCYLPLVTDLPADRLAFIARDAGIRILVVLDGKDPPAALVETVCEIIRPETLAESFLSSHDQRPQLADGDVCGTDLAYIIYTSGSTGLPKGVVLLHQGLNNLGVAAVAALGIRPDDKVALLSSPAFDAWISDMAMAWTAGAAVVPFVRADMDDVTGMLEKLARLRVSTATTTPSYLRVFERSEFPGLRLLMTVGEPPHPADVLHYAERLQYFNGYGPTENTAAASFGLVAPKTKRPTAGRPLVNTSVHILDQHGKPVPPGAVGLVWLGGMGLAAFYLNRPELTAASFVTTSMGRLYGTGDAGRWTSTGELRILGRSDGQVKLRGQRVELGEIEHLLGDHPGVRQSAAMVETRADGTQILWAFVCLRSGATEPTAAEWHDYLSRSLPSYMLPAAVLAISAMPVNTAGKTDRAALGRMAHAQRSDLAEADGGGVHREQPHDGMEARVAQVWAEHLGYRSIARSDNFFELGGDSLRAIAVVNQLRRTVHCTVNDLYERPRLADFAAACEQRPEHLRALLQSAGRHWRDYQDGLAAYDAERDATLAAALQDYEARNRHYRRDGGAGRRDYSHVLLTGATGYLGSYLLRELLAEPDRRVSVLVRSGDDRAAIARLGRVLCHYFGPEQGAALRDNPRLTVLAGDLRRDDLGLPTQVRDHLASNLQAIFHSAANVKHFGHKREFHADNVAATARLLQLAARRSASPADFHLVSTLSVCGQSPEQGFRLFTEYDAAPEALDDNYYIRSKQQAERLVVAARGELANACIHRVGNLVFAAEGGPLQFNIRENAFFRQLAAFMRLRVVPDDSHLWLCHVDVVARGIVLLAGSAGLTNETHHLENARRDTLAAFVTAAEGVRGCSFDVFLERLSAAMDETGMDAALTETLENFNLYHGLSPQHRARRLEIVSGRSQSLLAELGLVWPPPPAVEQAELLRQAAQLFAHPAPPVTREISESSAMRSDSAKEIQDV